MTDDYYSVSDIVQLWAAHKISDIDAAKRVAFQIDRDIYYDRVNNIVDSKQTATHLSALLRSLSRGG